MHKERIEWLFIVKQRIGTYGEPIGLHNSAAICADALNQMGITAKSILVQDGNSIDRIVTKTKPKRVIIEALWCTPEKLKELIRLHPHIQWFIRIHSRLPFLSQEGISIEWLKKYRDLGVKIAANHLVTADDLKKILNYDILYMPNLYAFNLDVPNCYIPANILNISCFGAIRPLKNQFIQAVAAMRCANKLKTTLHFHMNGNRIEQKGDPILKTIKSLFDGTKHKLILHPWIEHHNFLNLVKMMDIGMQVSYSESFNIVTADHITMGVPIVTSEDINWCGNKIKANTNSVDSQLDALLYGLNDRKSVSKSQQKHLNKYEHISEKVWKILTKIF